jgi:hypothetical protein
VKLGAAALIAGTLSAVGSFMIYGSSVWFDPAGWLRIPSMLLFPLGLLASASLGLMAIKGRGKALAIAGWAASVAGLALFVYAIVVLG